MGINWLGCELYNCRAYTRCIQCSLYSRTTYMLRQFSFRILIKENRFEFSIDSWCEQLPLKTFHPFHTMRMTNDIAVRLSVSIQCIFITPVLWNFQMVDWHVAHPLSNASPINFRSYFWSRFALRQMLHNSISDCSLFFFDRVNAIYK